ncbi:hypothetical protein KAR10_08530 [bacterium]|nr:hypothetical protein [bacterium]
MGLNNFLANHDWWLKYLVFLTGIPLITVFLHNLLNNISLPKISVIHKSSKPTWKGTTSKLILLSLNLVFENCLRKNRLDLFQVDIEYIDAHGAKHKLEPGKYTPFREITGSPLGRIELSPYDSQEAQGIIFVKKTFYQEDLPAKFHLTLSYRDIKKRVIKIKVMYNVLN